MIDYTNEQIAEARKRLIQAMAVLTFDAVTKPNLAARNVMFHAEELMKALDDARNVRRPRRTAAAPPRWPPKAPPRRSRRPWHPWR